MLKLWKRIVNRTKQNELYPAQMCIITKYYKEIPTLKNKEEGKKQKGIK